jgi:hypothetical protein
VAASQREAARLLLALIDSRTPADRIVELSGSMDYSALLDVARVHRVIGLVHRRLVDAGVDIPQPVAAYFQEERARAAMLQLDSYTTIAAISDAVREPFLVLKGPVLGSMWYGDPSVRRFSDIDVLVRRSDFETVLAQMLDAGFVERSQNWRGFLDHEVAEIPLAHGHATIDLHWDLVATGTVRRELAWNMEPLFDRAETVRLSSETVSTLDPADTLLHLCVNGGLDGARSLLRLSDIDVVARSGRIGWTDFLDRARKARAGALCAGALQRARSVVGTPLPSGLLAELEPFRGWLTLNERVDRRPRSGRRFANGVASGALLASGRDTRRQTLQRFLRKAGEFSMRRLGRPALTDPGGNLDWQRRSGDGNRDVERERYLSWVSDGAAQPGVA